MTLGDFERRNWRPTTSERIDRPCAAEILMALGQDPCVLIIGPFEVGKSAIADEVATHYGRRAGVVDGSSLASRDAQFDALIGDPDIALIIVDEVHAYPECLPAIRATIDRSRSQGTEIGSFLLLGSHSSEAQRLVGERLGTRARVLAIEPVNLRELPSPQSRETLELSTLHLGPVEQRSPVAVGNRGLEMETLWLRGGFPQSLMADSEAESFARRARHIEMVCNRMRRVLGMDVPLSAIETFLRVLATRQGEVLSNTELPPAQREWVPHFCDVGLLRRLSPWSSNEGKRYERHPKVYIRDSGLLHTLLGRRSHEEIRSDPMVYGHSWEGFCIENLIGAAREATPYFYRANNEEEIDLILEFGPDERVAIEIKGRSAKVSASFSIACDAIRARDRFVVRPVAASIEGGTFSTMTLRDAISRVERYCAVRER